MIGLFLSIALAIDILCFSPPDNLIPFSPIRVSNLFGNLFQFKTRYKYTDGQFSAWSGISSIQIPLNYFGNSTNSSIDNFQDSNQIRISYLDTIGDVEKIELAPLAP